MRELNGFVKIPRSILNWAWYSNPNTRSVFFHLLITANFQTAEFENEVIHRGEVATSYAKIGQSLTLTPKQVRVAIGHLRRADEVATRRGRNFLIITILRYDELQDARADLMADQRAIIGQSQGNHKAITGQQMKNDKNDKKEKKEKKCESGPPTLDDVLTFCQVEGLHIDVEKFFNHYESIGWMKSHQPIKDWKALARLWAAEDNKKAASSTTGTGDNEREANELKEDQRPTMPVYVPMSKTEAYDFLKEVQQYKEHFIGDVVQKYGIPDYVYRLVTINNIQQLDEEDAYCTVSYRGVPIKSQLEQRYILLLRFAEQWHLLLRYHRGYNGFITKIKGRTLPGLPYLVWLICDKMENDGLYPDADDVSDEVLKKYTNEAIDEVIKQDEDGNIVMNLPDDFFTSFNEYGNYNHPFIE